MDNYSKKDNGGAIALIVVSCIFLILLILVLIASLAPHTWLGNIPWIKVFRIGRTHIKRCCQYNNGVDIIHVCGNVDEKCPDVKLNRNAMPLENEHIISHEDENMVCNMCGGHNTNL